MSLIRHHPLALGFVPMLAKAIADHKRNHYGKNPRFFIVHPEHYGELRMMATPGPGAIVYFNLMDQRLYVMGVEIREAINVIGPVMVTACFDNVEV